MHIFYSEQHVIEYVRRVTILKNLITMDGKLEEEYSNNFNDDETIPATRNLTPREELLGRNGEQRKLYILKY